MTEFKSGFVTIVGRPNVGKSTLLNQIVGQKIAIMSSKAQTTRNKIQGVYTTDDAQIVFIDTPGIHKPQNSLDDFMVKSAMSALNEADAVWFIVDVTAPRGAGDDFIIDRLKQFNGETPVYLLLNKIDLLSDRAEVLEIITEYQDALPWAEIFPISALKDLQIDELLTDITSKLAPGPKYFGDDQIADHPERFLIAELIREKILQLTQQEVPHSVAVVIDSIKRENGEKLHIQASIIVERPTQKNIIIGKQGSMIKQIGQRARRDIERLLGDKVYLETWVKVKERWRDKPQALQELGYGEDEL